MVTRTPKFQYGPKGPAMHKAEEDWIHNWMTTLRRMRREGTGDRVVRCRKTASLGPIAKGTKRVHFVRHGEGHHNVHSTKWFDLGKKGNPWEHETCPVDPGLTDLGTEQANELNAKSQRDLGQAPEVVVVSPLMRTLQTATLGFASLAGTVPFVAHEDCREIMGQHRCDRRVKAGFRSREFTHVDFSGLHDGKLPVEGDPKEEDLEALDDAVFNEWGKVRESDQAAVKRALDFLWWLKDRPEEDIVVVTHSAWLCVAFNGAMLCDCEDLQSWFSTGEIRSTTLEFNSKERVE
ncbi:phosphoglycerate mutase-like protein [Chloropicon primus]|nr:phosphoglycerate mutase-like protein [Chloropicon primus]